jgi:hypothetical protein
MLVEPTDAKHLSMLRFGRSTGAQVWQGHHVANLQHELALILHPLVLMSRQLGAAHVEVTARRAVHHHPRPVIHFVRRGVQWAYDYLWDTRYPALPRGYDTGPLTMHVEVTVRCAPALVQQVEDLLITPAGVVGTYHGRYRMWHGGLQQIPDEWI